MDQFLDIVFLASDLEILLIIGTLFGSENMSKTCFEKGRSKRNVLKSFF